MLREHHSYNKDNSVDHVVFISGDRNLVSAVRVNGYEARYVDVSPLTRKEKKNGGRELRGAEGRHPRPKLYVVNGQNPTSTSL